MADLHTSDVSSDNRLIAALEGQKAIADGQMEDWFDRFERTFTSEYVTRMLDVMLAAERRRQALHRLNHEATGAEAMAFYCDRALEHERTMDAALAALTAHLCGEDAALDALTPGGGE